MPSTKNDSAPRQHKTRSGTWVTVDEVAEALGVHRRTVRRWIERGDLPAHRVGPRLLRVRVEDLEALAGGRIPSAASR